MKKAKVLLMLLSLLLPLLALLTAQETTDPLQYEIWVTPRPGAKDAARPGDHPLDQHQPGHRPGLLVPPLLERLQERKERPDGRRLSARSRPARSTATPTSRTATGAGSTWKRSASADGTDLTAAMQFMTPDEPRASRRPDRHARQAAQAAGCRGKRSTLELTFKARIPKTIRRSGYYHNGYFIGQWFPKPGVYQEGKGWNCHQYHLNSEFFADFADFLVHITVPRDYVVGASGKENGPHDRCRTQNLHPHLQAGPHPRFRLDRRPRLHQDRARLRRRPRSQPVGIPGDRRRRCASPWRRSGSATSR